MFRPMVELPVPVVAAVSSRGWSRGWMLALAYIAAIGTGAVGVAVGLQSTRVGFSGADESAHYLNAYFIAQYLTQWFGMNPMAAAQEFYLHYPKLSIGHWPPLYHATVGAIFTVIKPTVAVAMTLNVLLSTLPVLFVAWTVHRFVGPLAAVAAAAWYGTLPLVMQAQLFLMNDQVVAAWVCAAALAWVHYAARPDLRRALMLAALAAAGILTKGSGWLFVLVPPLHAVLTGRLGLLANWRTWVALAVGVLALLPWYVITFRITADSWFFEPGLDYSRAAIVTYTVALLDNLGSLGVMLAGIGTVWAWRGRRSQPALWSLVAACISLVVATLLFQSLVPASLEPRVMVPALPPLVLLATLGLAAVARGLRMLMQPAGARVAQAALAALLLLPGYGFLAAETPKVDLRLAAVASDITATTAPSIWLVDGSAGAEGALIAEVATRDPSRAAHVVRSTQLLADSNWTGRLYRLKAEAAGAVAQSLHRLGVRGVVVVRRDGGEVYPHSRMLQDALSSPASGYRLVRRLDHLNRSGYTEVYEAQLASTPNVELLRTISFPAKARSLGAAAPSAPAATAFPPTHKAP